MPFNFSFHSTSSAKSKLWNGNVTETEMSTTTLLIPRLTSWYADDNHLSAAALSNRRRQVLDPRTLPIKQSFCQRFLHLPRWLGPASYPLTTKARWDGSRYPASLCVSAAKCQQYKASRDVAKTEHHSSFSLPGLWSPLMPRHFIKTERI